MLAQSYFDKKNIYKIFFILYIFSKIYLQLLRWYTTAKCIYSCLGNTWKFTAIYDNNIISIIRVFGQKKIFLKERWTADLVVFPCSGRYFS
jgi:hypothetical protein